MCVYYQCSTSVTYHHVTPESSLIHSLLYIYIFNTFFTSPVPQYNIGPATDSTVVLTLLIEVYVLAKCHWHDLWESAGIRPLELVPLEGCQCNKYIVLVIKGLSM